MTDVYTEIEQILDKNRVLSFASKSVDRFYAFDDFPNVPAQASYLKLVYSFKDAALSNDLTGSTFSKIFGSGTNALELLLLKRKLMGPGWIKIKNASLSNTSVFTINIDILV